jgi:uncharacterized protein YdiU (UPF0061 family)
MIQKFGKILDNYGKQFWTEHDKMLAKKFGFDEVLPEDERFFTEWQQLMQDLNLDYTLFFKALKSLFQKLKPMIFLILFTVT